MGYQEGEAFLKLMREAASREEWDEAGRYAHFASTEFLHEIATDYEDQQLERIIEAVE